MKRFGKLLVVMMVLVMAVSLFAACENSEDDTEDIKNVVKSYVDAAGELDLDEAEKYVVEDSNWWEEMNENNSDDVYEEVGAGIAKQVGIDESYAAEIGELYKSLMKNAAAVQEIEIDEVKISEDGKSAEVKCSGKQVNKEALDEELNNKKFTEIATEMYGDKKFSNEELNSVRLAVVEEVFERVAQDFKTQKVEKTVELELIDDEWKITDVETE